MLDLIRFLMPTSSEYSSLIHSERKLQFWGACGLSRAMAKCQCPVSAWTSLNWTEQKATISGERYKFIFPFFFLVLLRGRKVTKSQVQTQKEKQQTQSTVRDKTWKISQLNGTECVKLHLCLSTDRFSESIQVKFQGLNGICSFESTCELNLRSKKTTEEILDFIFRKQWA